MGRLIDADELIDDIRKKARAGFPANKNLFLYAESCVIHAPTVDAVPVRRGKWIETMEFYRKCSECGETWHEQWIMGKHLKFCPNCGADMKED